MIEEQKNLSMRQEEMERPLFNEDEEWKSYKHLEIHFVDDMLELYGRDSVRDVLKFIGYVNGLEVSIQEDQGESND